eukprot:9498036-Pyramimonas_sp.AAC.1
MIYDVWYVCACVRVHHDLWPSPSPLHPMTGPPQKTRRGRQSRSHAPRGGGAVEGAWTEAHDRPIETHAAHAAGPLTLILTLVSDFTFLASAIA